MTRSQITTTAIITATCLVALTPQRARASVDPPPPPATGATPIPYSHSSPSPPEDPAALAIARRDRRILWASFGVCSTAFVVGSLTLALSSIGGADGEITDDPPSGLWIGSTVLSLGAAGMIVFGVLVAKHSARWPQLRRRGQTVARLELRPQGLALRF